MNISIQNAKNGELTATSDNIFLHSNYAPSKEAERFIENLSIPYTPSQIIITEPALSYIAKPLKIKYPGIKIGAVRYCQDFDKYNNVFDFILNFYEHQNDFCDYIANLFNEETLLSIYFLNWQPSSKAFSEIDKNCWLQIKKALENAKTLLITRQYFEKKWLINSFNFIKYINKPVSLNLNELKSANPKVLIIASGPSLKPAIKIIKENQEAFFIICLSSAISICLQNEIIPDLILSTDGGYWAGEHLKKLYKHDIVLALTAEAYCNKQLLSDHRVLPLIYEDGISKTILEKSGLKSLTALRNGTVSGTALFFALQYFNNDIFICGLDLSCSKGFQHTQPNELENNNSLSDNRIRTKDKRCAAGTFNNSSLDIYLNWFQNTDFNFGSHKVYRIIDAPQNKLNKISDITSDHFYEMITKEKIKNSLNQKTKQSFFILEKTEINYSEVIKYFESESKKDSFKKQIFPLDYVSLSHNTENSEMENKMKERYNSLIEKIRKIVYD